jgi:hypothetical protein
MIFKPAFALISALVQTTVVAKSTSTRLGQIAQDIKAGGEKHTYHLRELRKVQVDTSITIKDGGAIDDDIPNHRTLKKSRQTRRRKPKPNNSSDTGLPDANNEEEDSWEDESNEPWSRGTFEVAAKRKDTFEVCAPSRSQVGDILILFLR